jgi:hypothetical protein
MRDHPRSPRFPFRFGGAFSLYVLLHVSNIHIFASIAAPELLDHSVDARLPFVAFFLTDVNSSRIPTLVDYMTYSAVPRGFTYFLVNYTRKNNTALRSLAPPQWCDDFVQRSVVAGHMAPDRKSAELLAKFFFAMAFFLAHTAEPWMWRGTDDVLINFPRLPGLIADLNRRYRPLDEAVFQGHCIIYLPVNPPFMQGGSGYLLSRFACQYLVPAVNYIAANAIPPEDQYIGRFLVDIFKVMPWRMTNHRFMGFEFEEEERGWIMDRNFSYLPVCPTLPPRVQPGSMCLRFVAPIRDIVFFHQSVGGFGEYEIRMARAVFAAPEDVHWWIYAYMSKLCKNWPPIQ